MALNPSIILAGQVPDIVGTLDRSNMAAARANEMQSRRDMNALYQEHGPGIVAGDPNALNALAQRDPQAALGVKQIYRDNQFQDREFEMKVQSYRQQVGAQQAAAEAEQIKRGVFMASGAQSPQQWDQIMQQIGQPDLVGQFNQKDILLRQYMTAAQILEANEQPQPDYQIVDGQYIDKRNPQAGAQPVPGLQSGQEWRPATAEEAASVGASAGQINSKTGEFKRTPADKNMVIESDGKGGFVFRQGAEEQRSSADPSSPDAMIASIDGILNDPALDKSTGMLAWTQNIPGTDQRRFGARAKQLSGQAFLQAFQSLKGGGQITEIEGQKATEAIGRLDTAQAPDDYRQALTELRDILATASARPVGWAEQQSAAPQEMPQIGDEAGYDALPSGTMFIAPDGTQRRKP